MAQRNEGVQMVDITPDQVRMIDFHENSLMKEKEEELSEKEREEGKVAFSLRGIPLVF